MTSSSERHPHDWLLLLLALSCAALGILFVMVGAHVLEGALTPLDRAVREWTMESRRPFLIQLYTVISFIGDKAPLTVLCVIVGWRLLPGKRWWIPLLILCAVSVGTSVDWLKATYGVVRPEGGLLTSSSHSFPSGHSSGTAAIALFFAYVAARNHVRPKRFVASAMVLTVLVGISRVYLDEHWASDVVGGWMVGTALAAAFGALYEWVLRHQRLKAVRRTAPSGSGVTVN